MFGYARLTDVGASVGEEHQRQQRATPTGTRPETKQRYLEVAAALSKLDADSEPAYVHVASHVKLTHVAERLGVSRSSLYRRWETQHDYWRDLVLFMATREQEPWVREHLDATPSESRSGDLEAILDGIRQEFDLLQRRLTHSPRRILRTALLGYPAAPELRKAVGWERSNRQRAATRLDRMLGLLGRVVVAPLTATDLLAAIWILSEGVAHCCAVDPATSETQIVLDGDEDRPWSLLAYAVRCLILTLTAPSDGSAPPRHVAVAAPTTQSSVLPSWSQEQLDALTQGADLFAERFQSPEAATPGVEMLGHITLARVAREAGVTRRQLYHLWSSHDDFRRDLLRYIRAEEGSTYFSQFDDGLAAALESPRPSHIALDVCEHIERGRLAEPIDTSAHARFALEPHLNDPLVRGEAQTAMTEVMTFHQERIEAFVDRSGVELRTGVTPLHINHLLTALAHGSEVLRRTDPAAIRPNVRYRGGEYSTFSIACQAIVDHSVVEPRPAPDPAAAAS